MAPSLADLLRSPALARLILHFSLHPERALHFRALRRHTGLGIRSLQTELKRLEELELVQRQHHGRRVVYAASVNHPGWRPLRELVADFADPAEILHDALADVEGIESAFVFGSYARDDVLPHSDLDAVVIGENIEPTEVGRAALESSVLLKREVNIVRHSWDSLAERLRLGSPFTRSVLHGPKRWIIGEERERWQRS